MNVMDLWISQDKHILNLFVHFNCLSPSDFPSLFSLAFCMSQVLSLCSVYIFLHSDGCFRLSSQLKQSKEKNILTGIRIAGAMQQLGTQRCAPDSLVNCLHIFHGILNVFAQKEALQSCEFFGFKTGTAWSRVSVRTQSFSILKLVFKS